MLFNAAQLMKAQVGASLEADIHEEHIQLDEDLTLSGPLTGHVRMRRTNQGLLVDGWIDLTIQLSCSRCLKEFELPLHMPFAEQFHPTVDVITGHMLPPIREEEVFAIDEYHQVDLTEAIRQQALLALPMMPLCEEDCKGLCSQCGRDLNLGPCDCQPVVDTRFSVLAQLLQDAAEA